MFLSEAEKIERKTHNKEIMSTPEVIKEGTLPGDFLIVKLYAYEDDITDENGIVIPRYKAYETDGGRPAASIDNAKYRTEGVVLKVGSKVEDNYEVGDIVYVPLRVSLPNSQYFFNLNRDKPVSDFEGIVRIPSPMIEFNTRQKA